MTLPDALSAPRRLLKAAMPVTPEYPFYCHERLNAGNPTALPCRPSCWPWPPGRCSSSSSRLSRGGDLRFYDPATGRPIATLADERAGANAERGDRAVAKARVRELEEQLVDWESATP